VITVTEDDLIKRLNEWMDNMENRGMRVIMNKTKVLISGEWQKVEQKAIRWPCGFCGESCKTFVCVLCVCLQCFDTVGWASGRPSRL